MGDCADSGHGHGNLTIAAPEAVQVKRHLRLARYLRTAGTGYPLFSREAGTRRFHDPAAPRASRSVPICEPPAAIAGRQRLEHVLCGVPFENQFVQNPLIGGIQFVDLLGIIGLYG